MATKKKAYKGKYPGPDIFKGDAKMRAAYAKQTKGKTLSEAAKRKLASQIHKSSSKSKAPAKAPAKPKTPTKAVSDKDKHSMYPGVSPGNTASNASGSIQLQTNHDLNMQELDATEQYQQEVEAANAAQEQATITERLQRQAFDKQKIQDTGHLNANMAYRGLSGGVAVAKKVDLATKQNEEDTTIRSQLSQAKTSADTARKSAAARKLARMKQITLGRQEYTNQQSRKSPTQGSKAEDAGVRYIVPK